MSAGIKVIDELKDLIVKKVQHQPKNKALIAQDLRLEASEGKWAGSKDGNPLAAREDNYFSLGIRTLAGQAGNNAFGFAGLSVGEKQLPIIGKIIEGMQELSFKRAKLSAAQKGKLNKKHEGLKVYSTELAEVPAFIDTVEFAFRKNPLSIELSELAKQTVKATKEMKKVKNASTAYAGIGVGFDRKLFVSLQGSVIDQSWPITEAYVYCSAKGKASADYGASLGDKVGLEVMEGKNVFNKDLMDFSLWIAEGTSELADSPAAKDSRKEVNVVTDPWYNCLLVHEICGHPSEADRALKKEAAWAGRAWWFKSLKDNQLGRQVASDKVSVFSDPGLQGYGHYKYDDEGVKARKVYNIKEGILNEFLNSRETAKLLGRQANGG
ncbi:hypothetical protein HZB89_01905, partial [archaeon]|nr:hypothetical protein [archaeon]